MNVLLDTHTFLWFVAGDRKLSEKVIDAIENQKNSIFISIVSFWEIAIKLNLGKLEFSGGVQKLIDLAIENGFEILSLDLKDTVLVSQLDFIHRDPFDRILIAQAINNDLFFATADENIIKYPIRHFWQ
ncbi:MAG: type II toxin-antitoxin system VapC family toxin [Flavobacteriaceae bacterium]|nr:type II toxin-antitoxin system VapC family toxin [Flavobacteriaceae bacterium]